MAYALRLALPRERVSVSLVRHLAHGVLLELGVLPACMFDVELALTEACTNVLRHAPRTVTEYEVVIEIDGDLCRICVTDPGGADRADFKVRPADLLAETGRGMHLISALADDVRMISERLPGTAVEITKRLELERNSILGPSLGAATG